MGIPARRLAAEPRVDFQTPEAIKKAYPSRTWDVSDNSAAGGLPSFAVLSKGGDPGYPLIPKKAPTVSLGRMDCFAYKEARIMQLKTRMNGGESSLREVADAWKHEVHDFAWSTSHSDAWAVEFAKKQQEALLKEGPAKPDPRNVH